MTRSVRNWRIRTRLLFLIALNATVALGVTGVTLFWYENVKEQRVVVGEMTTQAGILAENCTAALSFRDERAAREMIASLRADPRLVDVAIYDSRGHVFAAYHRPGSPLLALPTQLASAGAYFRDSSLIVFEPVTLNADRIGSVFLRSSLNELHLRRQSYIQTLFLIQIFSLGAALLLGTPMQKSITYPIAELSEIARCVSIEKNYAARARKRGNDEIGVLTDSFNEMLSQIEARELARKAAEERLRESEERYALAARGANDGLWDWKLTTDELYLSPRWYHMLGYSEASFPAAPQEWFNRIHSHDRERVHREMTAHFNNESAEFASEYRLRHRNGSYIWVLTRGSAVRDASGAPVRIAGSQTDITEGKVADPLTGLPNRLYFLDRLENAVTAARQSGVLFAVLFLDLDRFKLINDSMGHAAGDEFLVEVATRLRSILRSRPVAGEATVARLGGDEFGILLTDLRRESDASLVADRILGRLGAAFSLDGRQVFASGSIGIALGSLDAAAEDILRNADTAMYHAKKAGRGRYQIFDEKMREGALARLEVEAGLRKAIAANQLVLYYQPEILIRSGAVQGFEALVRWMHPEKGLLAPGAFIPIAEESGLIVDLGSWVLETACAQMAAWHRRFPRNPALTISVNVSTRQLNGPGFADEVAAVLAKTGLDPTSLKLEVTESSFIANPEGAMRTLYRLKEMNVGLEVDDFGTGYSSLSYLQKLPFNTVKIDRSFVQGLGQSTESSEIVHTIIELSRSLKMNVIAEGVETMEQLNTLRSLGCVIAQGFYFARPASAGDSEALIREETVRHDFRMLQHATDMQDSEPLQPETADENRSIEFVPVVSPIEDYSPVSGRG